MKLKYKYLIFIFFTFFSCNPEASKKLPEGIESIEEIDIRIGWYLVPVKVEDKWLSMVYQEGADIGSNNWKLLYENINGFEFKPGEITDIRVKKEKLAQIAQDEAAHRYRLIKIYKKEKVPADKAFKLFMHKDFISFDGKNYSIIDNIPFDCGIACDLLTRKLENGTSISCRWSDDFSAYVYLD